MQAATTPVGKKPQARNNTRDLTCQARLKTKMQAIPRHGNLLGFFAFVLPFLMAAGVVETYPPIPAIEPGSVTGLDVHGFENKETNPGTDPNPIYEFTNPYIPPASTSLDNRIGLQRKMADGDPHPSINPSLARFFLFSPEGLVDPNADPSDPDPPNVPLMESGPGANIISDVHEEYGPTDFHNNPSGGAVSHLALCDPKVNANPTKCGDFDCYNLKIITGLLVDSALIDNSTIPATEIPKRDLQFWSVDVEIKVEMPKMSGATINDVTLSNLKEGATIEGVPDPNFGTNGTLGIEAFHNPMIVGDNRLLIARLGTSSKFTFNGAPGFWDSIYAHYSGGDECDVTKWDGFKPLAYAQVDQGLEKVDGSPIYGFTEYPMRSPSGMPIPTDKDFQGRYLWVDQAANSIFLGSLSRRLLDVSGSDDLFETSCLDGITCSSNAASENTAPHQGWMMMGLWTHGKMVLLDSMVNHSDFGLRAEEEHHRMVELYCDDNGDYNDCAGPGHSRTAIRVGAGRDEDRFVDSNIVPGVPPTDPNPVGWIDTTVQFGSSENFYNALPHMKPGLPRDVVWQITAGTRTDEIAFDDYISHRTLIFSPMNALKEMLPTNLTYYDGIDDLCNSPPPGDPNGPKIHCDPEQMRLQNAATTLKWDAPDYGVVEGAGPQSGRIENVALGGVKGRGFFLFEDVGIKYQIPDSTKNNQLDDEPWMVSLFYDNRKDPVGTVKRLMTFPGDAHIDLHGTRFVRICPQGPMCPATLSLELPKPLNKGQWTHLAFVFHKGDIGDSSDNDEIRVYQDGFLFETVAPQPGMEIEDGELWLGSPNGSIPGIEGWIDEFKVVEGPFSPEEVCNHARGTLVAVPYSHDSGTGVLQDLWKPFDIPSDPEEPGRVAVHKALHGETSNVSSLSDLYVCSIDYTSPHGVSLHDPGQGDTSARSLRRRLLFPEGPVVWNQPRPESIANEFCLSCHGAQEKGGLTLAALDRLSGKVAYQDSRRQPLQAPKKIFGTIPAHHVAEDKPPLPLSNHNLDEWIDDGPLYRWTMDEGSGGIPNWVIGDPDIGSTHATRLNGAHPKRGEFRGHALTLDGIDDYARVDSKFDITGDGMTVATWFQLGTLDSTTCVDSQINSRCTLLAKAGASEHWLLELYRNTQSDWIVRFKVSTINQVLRELEVTLPASFDATAWHHLAGTYGDGDLEVFLDGVSLDKKAQSSGDLAPGPNLWVTIGSRLDTLEVPRHPMKGKIDDPRIWNRPLLLREIEDLFYDTP